MLSKRGKTGLVLGLLLGLLAAAWLSGVQAGAEGNQKTYLPLALKDELPTPIPTATPGSQPPGDWRGRVNYYRGLSGLPGVTENPDWSAGGVLHGRYLVKNNVIAHAEDPGNPWYTPEGDAAGRNGNVAVFSSVNATDAQAIDLWMEGPFHAIAILDPQLHVSGFGSYREADGGWQMGATLDVLRGLGGVPGGVSFPIAWPVGTVYVPLGYRGTEWPDPMSHCGYSATWNNPSGPPLMLQLGSGGITPSVTAHSLTRNGTPIEHCLFDETNYVNPDAGAQGTGRTILNGRDAVVIMPRHPLVPGATYTASVTTNGQQHSWSFTVAGSALQPSPAGEAQMR